MRIESQIDAEVDCATVYQFETKTLRCRIFYGEVHITMAKDVFDTGNICITLYNRATAEPLLELSEYTEYKLAEGHIIVKPSPWSEMVYESGYFEKVADTDQGNEIWQCKIIEPGPINA